MAVSVNASLDPSRDALITMSFQLAGLLGSGKLPNADDIAMAASFMNLELMALQAEGVILRTVERTDLTLIAGTNSYTLPSDTIDLAIGLNDQAGTVYNTATGSDEALVTVMSRAEYMDVTDKSATNTGTPNRVYIEKQAAITLIFWPTPGTLVTTFRYARVRLLKDMDDGGVTVDLARRWLKFVAFAVAANVARAKSLGAELVGGLLNEAERLKAICKADDNQRGKIRFRVAHSGRNWP